MAKSKSTSGKKSALTKATEKRVREIAKQVEKTRRLYSPASKKWVKPTARSIASKAKILGQRDIVKAGKQVSKDARQINKTAKEAIKLINALFGEKEKATRKQAAKKTTPRKTTPKPQSKKQAPSKSMRSSRIYDVEDLPEAFNNATLNGTLEELAENADYYNSLLRPGDVFGGRIGFRDQRGIFRGGYTHASYGSFEAFINDLHRYRFVRDFGDDEDDAPELKSILQIIRFKAPNIKNPTRKQTVSAWSAKRKNFKASNAAKIEAQKQKQKKLESEISSGKKERKKIIKELEQTKLELRIEKQKTAMRKGKKK